jgi:hypothetical protein
MYNASQNEYYHRSQAARNANLAGHSIHLQEHKDQGWEEAKENVPQVSVNLQPHSALLDRTAQQNNDNEDNSHQNGIQNSSDEEQNEPVLEHCALEGI